MFKLPFKSFNACGEPSQVAVAESLRVAVIFEVIEVVREEGVVHAVEEPIANALPARQ